MILINIPVMLLDQVNIILYISTIIIFIIIIIIFIIILVGDLPILALRWNMTLNCATIDRCALISDYRNKKIASKTIEIVLQDIQQVSQYHNASIEYLRILVPQNSWIEECLKRRGYQEYVENEQLFRVNRGGISHIYLVQQLT